MKKATLKEVMDLLDKLQADYDTAKKEKEDLQAEVPLLINKSYEFV